MTARQEPPPNPMGVILVLAAVTVAGATVLLLPHPELWPWMAAVWAVAGLIGLGVVAAEARADLDGARAEVERLEADNMRMAAELNDTQGRLADALDLACEAPAPVVPLRVVPAQRDGSEYEWPRVARQIEHDDLTALMRGLEEK